MVSNVAAACSVICFTFIQRPQDVWSESCTCFLPYFFGCPTVIETGACTQTLPMCVLKLEKCCCRALYVLLFMQFSANSFYDPARRAITPTIVSSDKLPLATTIDSFAWSLVGAVGASLGGFAVRPNPRSASSILCAAIMRIWWARLHVTTVLMIQLLCGDPGIACGAKYLLCLGCCHIHHRSVLRLCSQGLPHCNLTQQHL